MFLGGWDNLLAVIPGGSSTPLIPKQYANFLFLVLLDEIYLYVFDKEMLYMLHVKIYSVLSATNAAHVGIGLYRAEFDVSSGC